MSGVSAQYPRLSRVSVNDVRLHLPKELFNLKVANHIIQRIDWTAKLVYNHDLVALPLCLVEELALRPQRRPGHQRDIMSPLRQDFTRDERVLLRPT